MQTKPSVSVIIPNYNHALYLKQRIDSVLNQAFQAFELIILDDCSTDNSREIIEQYRDNPKVSQIIYNQERLGENLFECFDVENKGGVFYIFKNDNWQEIPHIEKVIIQIEGNNILEKNFEIGKYLEFYDYPKPIFRINSKDVFEKKEEK